MPGRSFIERALPIVLGGTIGFLGTEAFVTRSNYIPNVDKVQQGYAVPDKLEIKLKDLDNSGERETILIYNGKSYLLRIDEKGKPSVDDFEIRPAEVVPKTSNPIL